MSEADGQQFLTYKEAAARLNIPVGTLYAWVSRRQIAHVRVNRVVRFDAVELQRFVDEHRISAREATPCK
jgi:excisionase family DNA binding protein